MKLLLPFVLLFGINGYSQIQVNSTSRYIQEAPNCHNRYNVDYKLADYSFPAGDSTILTQLDLESIEVYRSSTEDVVVNDPINNVNIILFKREASEIIEK